MRCAACNKDMKHNTGDEYYVKRPNGITELEDLCKACRVNVNFFPDPLMQWGETTSVEIYVQENSHDRFTEGRRAMSPLSDDQ